MSKNTNKPTEKLEKPNKIGTRSVSTRINQLEGMMQQGMQDLKNQINSAPKTPEIVQDLFNVITSYC